MPKKSEDTEKMTELQELEKARLRAITRISEHYRKKKEGIKKRNPSLNDLSFEIITDTLIGPNGIRYAKRKAIFLHHLNKYFTIKPRKNIK